MVPQHFAASTRIAAALTGHNAFGGDDDTMVVGTGEAVQLAAEQADDMLCEFRKRFPGREGCP